MAALARLPQVGVACTLFPRVTVAGRAQILTDVVALVLRGKAPAAGKWSLPGGKLHLHEAIAAGAAREVREELGVDVITVDFGDGVASFATTDAIYATHHYAIAHALAVVDGARGELPVLRAADDAAAAAWYSVPSASPSAIAATLPAVSSVTTAGPVARIVALAAAALQLARADGRA